MLIVVMPSLPIARTSIRTTYPNDTEEGDTILGPFIGAGTTAIAAKV
jgi:hypothetical protein